jgi:hypothetical protein
MITTCLNCDHTYWRYRRDHPPTHFCSVPCKEAFLAEREARAGSSESPGIPAAIVQLIYSHRRIIHQTDSILVYFDCAECDRLEELYGKSLAWHYREIAAEIARTPEKAMEAS